MHRRAEFVDFFRLTGCLTKCNNKCSFQKGEIIMMYIHYCRTCDKIHILSGHKKFCPACGHPLCELCIPFEQYSRLSLEQRSHLQKEIREADL